MIENRPIPAKTPSSLRSQEMVEVPGFEPGRPLGQVRAKAECLASGLSGNCLEREERQSTDGDYGRLTISAYRIELDACLSSQSALIVRLL